MGSAQDDPVFGMLESLLEPEEADDDEPLFSALDNIDDALEAACRESATRCLSLRCHDCLLSLSLPLAAVPQYFALPFADEALSQRTWRSSKRRSTGRRRCGQTKEMTCR